MDNDFFENLDELLLVDTSSPYHFEQQQARQSQTEWRYHIAYAKAMNELEEIKLKLEIVTAEILEELQSTDNFPPSARSEMRRTKVPLDKRWQKLRRKQIEAQNNVNVLEGAMKSLYSKGFRLNNIQKMVERQFYDVGQYVGDNRGLDKRMKEAGEMLDDS